MDASRGKRMTRSCVAVRNTVNVGKENVCPTFSRESLSASRSPLPEGFPRAPLQDITHILNPTDVPSIDGGPTVLGVCTPPRKRSKCLAALEEAGSSSRCETKSQPSDLSWEGLRPCRALEESVRAVHAAVESTHTEGAEGLLLEPNSDSKAGNDNVARMEAAKGYQLSIKGAAEAGYEETVQDDVQKVVKQSDKKCDWEERSSELAEMPSCCKSSRVAVARRSQYSSLSLSTSGSLRSAQEKPKLSSLMKIR